VNGISKNPAKIRAAASDSGTASRRVSPNLGTPGGMVGGKTLSATTTTIGAWIR
jgi:hypothetical protein